MRTLLPHAFISTVLLMLFSTHVGAYDKQSAMDAAKEEAGKLSIKDILTESSASGTVPEYGSDVSELKDLFAKGQGNLLTPGTSKADGCLSQTSMDCRAVHRSLRQTFKTRLGRIRFRQYFGGPRSSLKQSA